MGLFRILIRIIAASGPPAPTRIAVPSLPDRPMPREMRFPAVQANQPQRPDVIVKGRCWVIDGDTIVIGSMHLRLAGIDAPELDHPWGRQAKWALVKLCRGQTITARIKPEMSYDRVVAECFLPDGRDLAAELVKAGLALDWPKFSGGRYRHLEPPDARRKLWRASLRQGGLSLDIPNESRSSPSPARGELGHPRLVSPERGIQIRRANYRLGWLTAAGFLVVLTGCQLIGGDAEQNEPERTTSGVPAFASFEVTASTLNVRRAPTASSDVLGQIGGGTVVTPQQRSGSWYGVTMEDGSIGWVHSEFLGPIDR
jgi:endonuclease YncB( thermonuclease family)